MKNKKRQDYESSYTVTIVLMILLVLAGVILAWQVIDTVKQNKLIQENITNNLTNNIYFSNFTTGDLQLGYKYYQNYTPKLIIHCQPFKTMAYATESYPYWIYSQCAMVEANEHVNLYNYDLIFKKYHICFEFPDLNKSVGDCS